ncbi:MAG TPA: hypothetical protein VGK67_02190 [Myxococcales bacterium]|jgi:hypothetical protein
MEPIATYSERLPEVRRIFTLYPDRVVVEARWLWRGRFQTTVLLGALKPEVRRIAVRYRLHRYAGWAFALSLLGFAALFYQSKSAALGGLGILSVAVAVASGAVLMLTYPIRRIVFARFDPRAGRGGLDIGFAGNDAATFEAFVEQVRRQITRCPRA